MKSRHLVIVSLLSCVVMYIVEQYLPFDYLFKTISKVTLFLVVPLLIINFIKKNNIRSSLKWSELSFSKLKYGIFCGVAAAVIIFLGYFIFKQYIDFNDIVVNLNDKGITFSNFILVGLYITFGNSLLEEFYFRGFIFLNLYEESNKVFAYVYSSLLFAIYHIGIFLLWFNIYLIILAVFSLFVVGLLFNFVNTKSKNFLNSWIIHIFANISINIIGFIILI